MSTLPGNPRSSAAWALDRILTSRVPAERPLLAAAKSLDDRDARLLRTLVLGTLRWLRRLDVVVETASNRDLDEIDEALRSPLRLAVYQLLYLDRIPAHAVVDEAVDEARRRTHRGGANFVNAVLRRVAASADLAAWPVREQDPLRRLAIETSHPDTLVARWWRQFGEERTRTMLAASNRRKPAQLLVISERGDRDRAAKRLAEEGVQTRTSDVAPHGLVVSSGDPLTSRTYADGWLYPQDVASQAAALIPLPRSGESVLDMAAAPGGKSFSLLSYEPRLRVIAADSNLTRLNVLRSGAARLHLPVTSLVADGLQPPIATRFDRVVLDLPCSGTGTLRKHPELKWRFSEDEVHRLARQGARWLSVAAERVEPEGVLVVVTCSLEPEENGAIVQEFLSQGSGFELLALEGRLPGSLARWVTSRGAWMIPPEDVHDGFTVHVLRRSRAAGQRTSR